MALYRRFYRGSCYITVQYIHNHMSVISKLYALIAFLGVFCKRVVVDVDTSLRGVSCHSDTSVSESS